MRIGIFGRIFGYGLLLAVLGMTAAFLLLTYVMEFVLSKRLQPIANWLVHEVCREPSPARSALLTRMFEQGRLRVSLFDGTGTIISSTPEPFVPLNPAQLESLRAAGMLELTQPPAPAFAVTSSELAGYAITGFRDAGSIRIGPLTLASVFLVTALIAWPIAASLSRPIRDLRMQVSRFGESGWKAPVFHARDDEIGALGAAFQDMAIRVHQSIRSEKLLLAAISHELRTPLQRVRLALELAADSDGEALHFRATMADLDDLERILSDVLTFSRLDSQTVSTTRGVLRMQNLAPEEVVAECAMRFEEAHPQRNLEWTAAPDLPAVEGDARLLRRAVLNLLENAARYSPPSSPVHLGARAVGSEVFFEVRDHGPGISPEHQQQIFEPFCRLDEARSSPGSGLGLAIAQKVATAHGGRVDLESSPEGSLFRLVIQGMRETRLPT